MNEVTTTGQNVDVAIEAALHELQTTKENVEVCIIDEGKKGLFGLFGTKPAIVRVQLKIDPITAVKEYLQTLVQHMGVSTTIEVLNKNRVIEINITGENVAKLIGKRGQTLNALQLLTQLAANKLIAQHVTVFINVGHYREQRRQILIKLASRLADQVVKTNKTVKLEPMPSFERKIVHHTLSKDRRVSTYSEGNEPNRYVVIESTNNK